MWVWAQILGAVLVVAGVAWVFPPAGVVLLGVGLIVAGIVGEG